MKTVGIVIREWRLPDNNTGLYGFKRDLLYTLRNYNINVIGIPINFNNDKLDNIKDVIDMCDGIILSGGKDEYEIDFDIVRYLYEKDIPTLGICLGMQDMGGAFNGGIIDHIGNNNHSSSDEYVHNITIDKNSLLYEILGNDYIKVNSRHFDYIKDTTLDKVAYSDDNILEAIEDKTKRCFIGVQWHPESVTDEYSKKLFDYFISKL